MSQADDLHKGRTKGQRNIVPQDEEETNETLDEAINSNLREKTEERLIFRKVPFLLWIVGSLILIVTIYLVYTLALGYFGVLKKGNKQVR